MSDRESWCAWLRDYIAEDGGARFFDALISTIQGAESVCQYCGEPIYCDIIEGGGIPDWGARFPHDPGLDYGCEASPDTCEEGTGSHLPIGVKEGGEDEEADEE